MLIKKTTLGNGFYTPPEVSIILKIPSPRIRYIEEVWDNRFGETIFNERYSWDIGNQKAINFLVLVEFKIVVELKKIGLSTQKIFKARNNIAKEEGLPYPFASSKLLANAQKIWYEISDLVIDANGTQQINFRNCVEEYTKCIDFKNDIAERLWPDTKQSDVVVDPHHQFGQPIISGTNITTRTIYSMYESGETVETLKQLYNLSEKSIVDVVKFYQRKAA